MIQISMGFLKKDADELKCFKDYIEDFKLNLPTGIVYDVSLDQSNTCTGVCIRPVDESFLIVMEVLNVNTPNEFYRLQLKSFLKEILGDREIRYLIMEEPLGYITGRRNRQLTELKKVLSGLKTELNVKVFTTIAVSSWRHGLMPKKVDGNRQLKETVVKAVLEIYPALEQFLLHSNTDTDGIEAVGILLGYFARHGVKDNILKNIGKVNTRKKAIACYKYVDVSSGNFAEIIKLECFHLEQLAMSKGSDCYNIKSYNEEFNVYGNAKMALTNDVSLTVVSHELDALSVLIRMGLKPKPNHVLLMGVINERLIKPDLLRTLFEDGFMMYRYQ